jgi:hypothetical protein
MPDVYANPSCQYDEFSRHQRGSVQPILSVRHAEFGALDRYSCWCLTDKTLFVRSKDKSRSLAPLWIISLFISLTETVVTVTIFETIGGIQLALTIFAIIFPVLIALGFFSLLWFKPYVFYPPGEFSDVDVEKYVVPGRKPVNAIQNNLL